MKINIPIIFEDDYLVAVNKPPNLGVLPGKTVKKEKSLIYLLSEQYPRLKNCFLLHRLDLKTSGVLLLGKNKQYRKELEEIMKAEDTQKTYWALIKGRLKEKSGILTKKIPARTSGKTKSFSYFRVLKQYKYVSLAEINIKTGRKHQIRRQFAIIYHPVIMDKKFGDFKLNRFFQKKYGLKRQFLHAKSIHFTHPIFKKRVNISTPLAKDLEKVLIKIKK